MSWLRGANVVVDWHNYTWSMLTDRWKMDENSLALNKAEEVSDQFPNCFKILSNKEGRRVG